MNSPQALRHVDRHDPGPLEEWRGSLERVLERREVVLARTPLPSDGTELFACDLELAALHSLFDGGSREVAQRVARGAGAVAAAALCRAMGGGAVLLAEPGRPARSIPTGDSRLDPAGWRDGFALACAARDPDALSVLCAPGSIADSQLPAERADPFWLPYCRSLASLVTAPEEFPDLDRAARAGMERARIASPEVVAEIDRPLLDLARALLDGDAARWNAEVARALEAHREHYAAESRRYDRRGFLAFGVVGLCALAHHRGMETRVESPYLPAELVRGVHPVELSTVTGVFPRRTLVHDGEAAWFLDLAGFPRASRSHRIVEQDGLLLARYEARGAAGMPHARIDFVLDDGPALPPLALDAGELLWLAQLFASEAGEPTLPPGERRALLSEAVDCVDAALARAAPGGKVPAETLRSERGREMLRAEPGRFRRERMAAYREALAGSLARLDAEPAPAAGSGDAARASAMASIELIRAQVTPILEAIARDRAGEAVRMLRPRPEDYAKVFVGEAADVARRAYDPVWERLDVAYPSPQQTELRSFVAPAGMLAEENELSREFPGGYRAIARWLNPHRVWVRWKYVQPGQTSGLAYDGLVWCDDHWAWFPKPYRALRELGR